MLVLPPSKMPLLRPPGALCELPRRPLGGQLARPRGVLLARRTLLLGREAGRRQKLQSQGLPGRALMTRRLTMKILSG